MRPDWEVYEAQQDVARLRAENERLRVALRRLLLEGVQECDPWTGSCNCATFQARDLVGDPRQAEAAATGRTTE